MHYLYKISNALNDKIYIGQTIDPYKRWCAHKTKSKSIKPTMYIHNAMSKYGIENFKFEIIASSKTQHDTNEAEKQLIKQYESLYYQNGYNLSIGGEAKSGYKLSEETKRKISESEKGKIISDESKIRMSLARSGISCPEISRKRQSETKFKNKILKIENIINSIDQIRLDYLFNNLGIKQIAKKHKIKVDIMRKIIHEKGLFNEKYQ